MTMVARLPIHSRRSDSDEADPIPFKSGFYDLVLSKMDSNLTSQSPLTYAEQRRVSRAFLERVVEDYVGLAMQHVRVRQLPDGFWIADVVGLDGAWSDGETAEEAIDALPDIIFDWAMLKVADRDGDIPPMGDIDLNTY